MRDIFITDLCKMCRHNCVIEPDDEGIMCDCSDYKPNTSYNKFIFDRLQEPNLRYCLHTLIEKHILFRDQIKKAEKFWEELEIKMLGLI